MTGLFPVSSDSKELMDVPCIFLSYTKAQADQANRAFDDSVKQYLRHWIEHGTVTGVDRSPECGHDTDDFIEQGALRSFFKHRDDAFERLLEQDDIARHLLRPGHEVYFEPDAYEPLLAKFEKRIYNLAVHREHLEIPFRYSPTSRQGTHGDSVGLADRPPGEAKEDIGLYFGTRRSDRTALAILGRQLHHEALFSKELPIHVVTEGYMEDSLRTVRKITEQFRSEGQSQLHCFVIQRRHAADDRHLSTALLLMNPQHPDVPHRLIFCDTLKPNGLPPWWNTFKRCVDVVFPPLPGAVPVSDELEDGGVNLQRLHDGVPIRHQDIDCAFYTASMSRALIQIAKQSPDVLISGSIDTVVSQMTERMPEYFERANRPKAAGVVREVNVLRRWQAGQEALTNLIRGHALEPDSLHREPTDQPTPGLDLSAAA